MDKRQARALARALRRRFTPQQWAALGRAMAGQLVALAPWQRAQAVFGFASLPDEPDTGPILQAALAAGKRLYLPRVLPGPAPTMEAVPVDGLAALAPAGPYAIPEPVAGQGVGPGALGPGCLALVPCLAADAAGVRLGRGGGYYDRFLAGFGGMRLLLCPQALVLDALPCDSWDIRFAPGEILTEAGLLSTGKERWT